jgi:hypothetical protein
VLEIREEEAQRSIRSSRFAAPPRAPIQPGQVGSTPAGVRSAGESIEMNLIWNQIIDDHVEEPQPLPALAIIINEVS